jgi:hypothetical protein
MFGSLAIESVDDEDGGCCLSCSRFWRFRYADVVAAAAAAVAMFLRSHSLDLDSISSSSTRGCDGGSTRFADMGAESTAFQYDLYNFIIYYYECF